MLFETSYLYNQNLAQKYVWLLGISVKFKDALYRPYIFNMAAMQIRKKNHIWSHMRSTATSYHSICLFHSYRIIVREIYAFFFIKTHSPEYRHHPIIQPLCTKLSTMKSDMTSHRSFLDPQILYYHPCLCYIFNKIYGPRDRREQYF